MAHNVLFISLLGLGHAKYVRLTAVNKLEKQFNEYKYIFTTSSKGQAKMT
jgi:hypothetical protein